MHGNGAAQSIPISVRDALHLPRLIEERRCMLYRRAGFVYAIRPLQRRELAVGHHTFRGIQIPHVDVAHRVMGLAGHFGFAKTVVEAGYFGVYV